MISNGRLSQVGEAFRVRNRNGTGKKAVFECECGRRIVTTASDVRRGKSLSCGCLNKERRLRTVRTHGHTVGKKPTPTFKSWESMLSRCYREKNDNWQRYGGRGITVCPQWRDFRAFLADMGERPVGMTLDRINSNGNYEPGNCRWATAREQGMNKKGCAKILFQGECLTMSEIARRVGINYHTFVSRMRKGWSLSDAVKPPEVAGIRKVAGR